MSSIVIVGAGEQADLAYEYFTHDSEHDVVGFAVEDAYRKTDEHLGLPVVAFEEIEQRFAPDAHEAFVAVSSQQLNRVRARLYAATKDKGYTCASYVSSRAFVWHNVEIGENTFVFENNVLQHMVSVGDDVVLWSGNHVGHQTRIGSHCFITSHCVISGFCEVGDYSFLGVNCAVGDERKIGSDAVVGAGAVVVKDLDPRGVYVGNPAKPTGRDSFESFGVKEA